MQAPDIERSLAALGQELQHLGVQKPLRLLLVGGAFMLTHIRNSAQRMTLSASCKPRRCHGTCSSCSPGSSISSMACSWQSSMRPSSNASCPVRTGSWDKRPETLLPVSSKRQDAGVLRDCCFKINACMQIDRLGTCDDEGTTCVPSWMEQAQRGRKHAAPSAALHPGTLHRALSLCAP